LQEQRLREPPPPPGGGGKCVKTLNLLECNVGVNDQVVLGGGGELVAVGRAGRVQGGATLDVIPQVMLTHHLMQRKQHGLGLQAWSWGLLWPRNQLDCEDSYDFPLIKALYVEIRRSSVPNHQRATSPTFGGQGAQNHGFDRQDLWENELHGMYDSACRVQQGR